MKKYIKYIFITIIIMLLSVPVLAQEEYSITYDYGVAAIKAEQIVNNNPAGYSQGDSFELSAASCEGFEFAGWYSDDSYNNVITSVTEDMQGDITLYAKWYEMTYNINYILKNDSVMLDESQITNNNVTTRKASEQTYIYAPMCSSSDYVFDGWYLDKNFTIPVTYIESYTCEDVTLYAKWVCAEYSVYYDMGEAEISSYRTDNPNPDSYVFGTEIILEDAVSADPSLTFEGWYSDSLFTNQITSIAAGTSGSLVIYAKWGVKTYSVNYVLADDSGISEESITNYNPDTRTCLEDFILSDPVTADKNYKFAGWYTSPDFSKDSSVTKIRKTIDSDITLYAKWVTAVYNISYTYAMINPSYLKVDNPNPTQYCYGDTTVLLPVEAPGFIFNGWCTDSTLKNKTETIPEGAYGDITLYADFTEKTYSITYVLGGNGVEASQVVNGNKITVRTTTEQVSLEDAQTINTDYEFAGWYLDPEYTQEVSYIRAYTVGNITLYAKWEKKIVYVPVWGDATVSDLLSAADARLILRYSAGLETAFTDIQMKLSDINNDGNVNAADARLVLRLAAAIEKEEDLITKYNLPEIVVEHGEILFK